MTCDATDQFEVSWPRTRINTEYRSVLPHLHIDDVIAVMAVITCIAVLAVIAVIGVIVYIFLSCV